MKILSLYACSKFREIGHVNLRLEPKDLRRIKYISYMIFVFWATIMQDVDLKSALFSLCELVVSSGVDIYTIR